MPETQFRERTALARQRSSLALTLIAALLLTHTHAWLGASAALVVAAIGVSARSPGTITVATGLAAVCAALIVIW